MLLNGRGKAGIDDGQIMKSRHVRVWVGSRCVGRLGSCDVGQGCLGSNEYKGVRVGHSCKSAAQLRLSGKSNDSRHRETKARWEAAHPYDSCVYDWR